MFLTLFKISILLGMLFGGGFLIRECFLLRSGQRLKSIHSYRGVTPEQHPTGHQLSYVASETRSLDCLRNSVTCRTDRFRFLGLLGPWGVEKCRRSPWR